MLSAGRARRLRDRDFLVSVHAAYRRLAGASVVKPPYRTPIDDVPLEHGLRHDDGWIDMQVQFLIDARAAGSDKLVVGRTVLPPGARHEAHAHPHCDEFLVVMSGSRRDLHQHRARAVARRAT